MCCFVTGAFFSVAAFAFFLTGVFPGALFITVQGVGVLFKVSCNLRNAFLGTGVFGTACLRLLFAGGFFTVAGGAAALSLLAEAKL